MSRKEPDSLPFLLPKVATGCTHSQLLPADCVWMMKLYELLLAYVLEVSFVNLTHVYAAVLLTLGGTMASPAVEALEGQVGTTT